MTTSNAQTDVDVAILGTGFSGLCMAIELQREGCKRFTLIERAGDVGGTWRDNDYPGAASRHTTAGPIRPLSRLRSEGPHQPQRPV